MRMIHILLNLL